jgi:hypothetical protein
LNQQQPRDADFAALVAKAAFFSFSCDVDLRTFLFGSDLDFVFGWGFRFFRTFDFLVAIRFFAI